MGPLGLFFRHPLGRAICSPAGLRLSDTYSHKYELAAPYTGADKSCRLTMNVRIAACCCTELHIGSFGSTLFIYIYVEVCQYFF